MLKIKLIWNKRKGLIIVGSVLSFLICYASYQSWLLNNKGAYTAGKVIKFGLGSHNARYADFMFMQENEKYYGTRRYNSKLTSDSIKPVIGKKYLVKYDLQNPNVNTILFNYQLSDTVRMGTVLDRYDSLDIKIKPWFF